jgi:hypothetical protein
MGSHGRDDDPDLSQSFFVKHLTFLRPVLLFSGC